jgi:hypothetical protein
VLAHGGCCRRRRRAPLSPQHRCVMLLVLVVGVNAASGRPGCGGGGAAPLLHGRTSEAAPLRSSCGTLAFLSTISCVRSFSVPGETDLPYHDASVADFTSLYGSCACRVRGGWAARHGRNFNRCAHGHSSSCQARS